MKSKDASPLQALHVLPDVSNLARSMPKQDRAGFTRRGEKVAGAALHWHRGYHNEDIPQEVFRGQGSCLRGLLGACMGALVAAGRKGGPSSGQSGSARARAKAWQSLGGAQSTDGHVATG